jgi:hypothetical protein
MEAAKQTGLLDQMMLKTINPMKFGGLHPHTCKQEGGGRGRKCCICRFHHNLTVACEYESINK